MMTTYATPLSHTDCQENGEGKTLWKRAFLWLLFLGPFFFLSYGLANNYAARQSDVGHIVFNWEQHIPFIPWMILPYWSIDLLYVLALFIATQKRELDTLARRLLTAQVIAVLCFVLFPLHYSVARPETSGLFGLMFDMLSSFDLPYNQAPSLHIALLIILWVHFPKHLSGIWKVLFHALCVMIGISVLTTWQHHFIDVPTGVLSGWFSIWLWPENHPSVFACRKVQPVNRQSLKLSLYYVLAAVLMAMLAIHFKGWALWLFWPVVSLLLVALCYLFSGVDGFQKSRDGHISLASQWLFWPYLQAVKINARLWTARDKQSAVHISDGIWLGQFPDKKALSRYHTIIDLTAEMERPKQNTAKYPVQWHSLPNLDLQVPSATSLRRACQLIERHINRYQGKQPLLVCCALGYSRSAMVMAFWLVHSGRVEHVEHAIKQIKQKRPQVVIEPAMIQQDSVKV